MVEKWGYTEDFLQLKVPINDLIKNKTKYKCTPNYLKKSIITKIKNSQITIDDASNILKCSSRNIKNWLKNIK